MRRLFSTMSTWSKRGGGASGLLCWLMVPMRTMRPNSQCSHRGGQSGPADVVDEHVDAVRCGRDEQVLTLLEATVEAEDDGAVLSLVSAGHGMATRPALSLIGAPDAVGIADLDPRRPTRQVGYLTTSQPAGSAVVRAFVGRWCGQRSRGR